MSQSFWISIYIIWQCQLFFVLYIKMGGGYNTFISNTKVLEHLFFKDFQIFSNKFLSLKLSAVCCFNFFRIRFFFIYWNVKIQPEIMTWTNLNLHTSCVSTQVSAFLARWFLRRFLKDINTFWIIWNYLSFTEAIHDQTWTPFTQKCFLSSLVEISLVV